jgi:hypothetical protein
VGDKGLKMRTVAVIGVVVIIVLGVAYLFYSGTSHDSTETTTLSIYSHTTTLGSYSGTYCYITGPGWSALINGTC